VCHMCDTRSGCIMSPCRNDYPFSPIWRVTNGSTATAPPRTRSARRYWQIVWLLAQGQSSAQVAAVTGCTSNLIRTIGQRYNQQGPAGLGDRCHRNPGAAGRGNLRRYGVEGW
jgi:hypothetical protein